MRVVLVTIAYWPATEFGGPVSSVAALAGVLKAAGASVEVVTTNVRGRVGLPKVAGGTESVRGVTVHYFDAFGPRTYGFSPGLAFSLWRSRHRWDVAHLHGLWTFPTVAAARLCGMAGIPYVLSVHGMLSRFSLQVRFMRKRAYLAVVEGRTIEDASVVHYTAVAERDSVPTRFRGLRSVVVPHAVEAEALLRIPSRMERSGPLRVVILGRLHPTKGFDLLVPALAEVRRCGIDARLNVVGPDDDGYGAEVRRMARVWGVAEAVIFAGEQDRMGVAAALEGADLLVAPSYHENFGMAVVEGMAAGRPVIVSRGVAIADDVLSQGAGVVVPLEVNALAGAIRRLAEAPDERVRLGEAGRRLVVRRYVGSAVAKPMLEVYRDVLARARRTGRKAGEECGTGTSRCEC